MSEAAAIIARLDLARHPEGGWYRETWRGEASSPGRRGAGTAILFLLEAGQVSHWHRVDATELWIFQAGAPLTLQTARGDQGQGGVVSTVLGRDVMAGHAPQHVVAPHEWQSAHVTEAAGAGDGWSLVACVVVPAFEFSGFELAAPGWAPIG